MQHEIIIKAADGSTRETVKPVDGAEIKVAPGEDILLVDENGSPSEVELEQKGQDLIIHYADGTDVVVDDFYALADQEDPITISFGGDAAATDEGSNVENLVGSLPNGTGFSLMRYSNVQYANYGDRFFEPSSTVGGYSLSGGGDGIDPLAPEESAPFRHAAKSEESDPVIPPRPSLSGRIAGDKDPDLSNREVAPGTKARDIIVTSLDSGKSATAGHPVRSSWGELLFEKNGQFTYYTDGKNKEPGLDIFLIEYPVEDPEHPGETLTVTETLVFDRLTGKPAWIPPTVTNDPEVDFFDDDDNNNPLITLDEEGNKTTDIAVASVDNAGNEGATGGAGDPVTGGNGVLVFNIDGTYDYIMDPANPLGEGETETYTVTYTDENGNQTTETITIVGTAPVPVDPEDPESELVPTAAVQPPLSGEVGVQPEDPDGSDRQIDPSADQSGLKVVSVDTGDMGIGGELVEGSRGSLVFNEDGTYDYVPDPLAQEGIDTYTVTYPVEDPANPGQTLEVTETLVFYHDGAGTTIPVPPTVTNDPDESFFDDPDNKTPDPASSIVVASVDNAGGPDSTGGVGDAVHGDNGVLVFNSDGTYDYVMDPANPLGAGETETFTVTYTDEDGKTTVETIEFVGNGDDGAEVNDPVSFEIGVSPGDPDASDRPIDPAATRPDITVVSVDTGDTGHGGDLVDGSRGELVFNEDGTFDYNPDPDAPEGIDTFTVTYPVEDPANPGQTLEVTETLVFYHDGAGNVLPVPPTVTNDPGESFFDDPDNKTPDPASSIVVASVDNAGGPDSTGGVGDAVHGDNGVLVFNSDGTYDYVMDPANPLGAGETETFTVTYTDENGKTTVETIEFVGNGDDGAEVNDPVSFEIGVSPGDPDTSDRQIDPTATRPDITVLSIDTGDTGHGGELVDGSRGELVFNEDGTFDYNPDPGAPAGLDTFTVEYPVEDPANPGETILVTETLVFQHDGSGNVTPLAPTVTNGPGESFFDDPDNNTPDLAKASLRVDSVDNAGNPGSTGGAGDPVEGENGILVFNNDGTYDYLMDPNAPLGAGETETFTVTYTDENGKETVETLVFVGDGNGGAFVQPPTSDNIVTADDSDNRPVDPDTDKPDILVTSLNTGDTGEGGELVDGQLGNLVFNEDGTFDYNPIPDAPAGVDIFTVRYPVTDPSNPNKTIDVVETLTFINDGNGNVTILDPTSGQIGGQGDPDTTNPPVPAHTPASEVIVSHPAPGGGTETTSGNPLDGNFGVIVVNPDGTFDYVPDQDAPAGSEDTFLVTYPHPTIPGKTVTETLTFVHDGNGDAPIVPPDSTGDLDRPGESPNINSQLPIVVESLETGDSNTPGHLVGGEHSDIVFNPDGTFDINVQPDATPLPGETETFRVTYFDPQFNQQTQDIVVEYDGNGGANVLPFAHDAVNTAVEDTAGVSGDLVAYDVDSTDPVVVSGGGAGQFGTLTIDAQTGAYDYALDNLNGQVQALAEGETLTDTFTYTVTDAEGGSVTRDVTITVVGVNDKPVANDDTISINEDTVGSDTGSSVAGAGHGLLSNDSDVDTSDEHRVSKITVAGANYTVPDGGDRTVSLGNGTLTVSSDGSYRFDPGQGYQSLNAGESATETFTYTILDNHGGTDTATVTIEIGGVNDGPAITINELTLEEGETVDITPAMIAAADVDDDPVDLVFTVTNLAGGEFLVDGQPSTTFTQQDINDGRVQFVHDGGEIPPAYDLTVTDSGGLADSEPLTANYTPINDAPVANDDSYTTDENTPKTIKPVSANDTDAENDHLVITEIDGQTIAFGVPTSLASGAEVTVKANGDVVYNPNGAFEGLGAGETATDSFTYLIDDGNGGTDTATVTFTITGVNDGPTITANTMTLQEGETIPITTANINATDPDDSSPELTFTVTNLVGGQFLVDGQPATSFTLKDVEDGRVQFEHDGGEKAPSYTLTVADPDGLTDSDPLTANYTPINDAPVANDDSGTTNENTQKTVSLVGNDTDAENNPLSIVNLNGSFAGVGIPVTLASGATVMSLGNGDVIYNPNGAFESLVDGQTATDTFTYTISDGQGGSDTATVTMTITGVNDAPVITANTMTITEGQTIPITTANISATDADHGPTDLVFTVSNPIGGQFLVDGQPATSFTQQDIADGRVQFQHDGGEHAPSYTLTVTDPGNLTDTSPLTANYTAINDAPVANDDAVSINENTDKSIAVLGNDTDAEGDPLQIISANGAVLTPGVPFTLASGAQITLLGGEIKYSPNGAFESLGTGDTATDSFTYTIDDGHGGRDTATVTVTINGVNDAPVANDDGTSVDENGTVNLGLIGNDTDAEDGTPTISKIGNTAVTPGSMVTLASGAIVTVNADGSVDYDTNGKFDSLAAGQTATDSFVYTVVDSEGLTDTATATFTITGTNDAPVAADNSATTTQNSPKNVAVLPNDTDAEGQTLSITEIDGQLVAVGVPIALASGALVTLKPDGTIDYNPNGQFNSLAGGQNGTDTFTYTISDGHGGTDTASVVMTITGVNDAPVAMNDLEHVAEDGVANFDPRLNDIDPDLDPLAITQINGVNISVGQTITLASGAEVTLKADGTVDYDPNDQFELPVGQTATDSFTYTVSDGHGGTATATANIIIDGVNDAPVGVNDYSLGNTPGRAVTFDVTANDYDVDGTIDPTTVDLDLNTAGIQDTLVVAGEGVWTTDGQGNITFTPDANLQGQPTQVQYAVQDNDGASTGATGELTVTYATFDLWFGNDLSGSVDNTEFAQSRALISGMADLMPFSETNGAKAALYSWSATGQGQMNIGLTADDQAFVNSTLTYSRPFAGGTNIDYAINFGVQQIQASLQSGGAGRPYADQVLVILTDASPSSQIVAPQAAILNAAAAAKAAGITLAFIAIQEAASSPAGLAVLEQAASLDAAGNPLLMTAPTYAGISQAQIIDIIAGIAPQHAQNILNEPILAIGDQSNVAENATVNIDNPLNNDNHVSNDVLTLTEIDTTPIGVGQTVQVSSGALVTLNADGSLTYDPNGQFGALNTGDAQLDQFEYTVIDQSGHTTTGTISVTVQGVSGVPPIVIDLDGDGVEFDGLQDGILFDIDGDGQADQTAWADEDDAVLIYDGNANGQVDDVSEFSFTGYREGAETDLEGLQAFDTDGDGTLGSGDAEFSKFALWQDADGDGIVDDGELTSLEDAGIVSIDLLSDNQGYYTAGGDVRVHGVAQVTYADGSTTTAADAEFVYQNAPVAEAVLTDDGQAIEVSTDDGQALTIEAAPAADSGSSAVDDGSAAAVPSLTTEEEAAAAMAHAG